MSDLRKAAEMALAKLDHLWEIAVDKRMGADVLPEIKALRQALAQPECVDAVNMSQERVDETVKGEHKPYGYVWTSLRDGMEVRFSRMPPNKFYNPQDTKPVYTAPPKREWVGLTDEEYEELLKDDWGGSLIRSVEAKLKEKNT